MTRPCATTRGRLWLFSIALLVPGTLKGLSGSSSASVAEEEARREAAERLAVTRYVDATTTYLRVG